MEPRGGARPISASQAECGRANSCSELHRAFLSSQCEDLAAPEVIFAELRSSSYLHSHLRRNKSFMNRFICQPLVNFSCNPLIYCSLDSSDRLIDR